MSKTTYRLVRITPQGQEKVQGPLASVRKAASAAFYVLADNTQTSRQDANAFAGELASAPVGTVVRHEATGYAFRIEPLS